ncbi:MAG: excinuclease ABC subunit UvrC [Armatimonadota bacterium]|nr:excinuclease ABC subunit UvrC [Armatimonadota bacterium]
MKLQEKLDQLPANPGVYLFKDAAGDIIYVGKAQSLRARVRSYFSPGADLSPRVRLLVQQVEDLDFIIADSHGEALVLEFTLIQKHQPRFNVRYRDDKSYPYIRIDLREPFPSLCVVRRMRRDGARYFGPFPSTKSMWRAVGLARRLFGIRQTLVASAKKRGGCSWKPERGHRPRPCLEYFIERCLAPCAEGFTTPEEYGRAVRQVCDLLDGKHEYVLAQLRADMDRAAGDLHYEAAARLRDRIAALQTTLEGQKVVSSRGEDLDVLGHALREDTASVAVFEIREGRLVAQEHYLLEGVAGTPAAEVLNEFAKQHYQKVAAAPRRVLLPAAIGDASVIEELLQERRRAKVVVHVPKRGEKKKLVEMAQENAEHHLRTVLERESAERRRGEEAVGDLQKALGLPVPPRRIEAFDISNVRGKHAVGAMIVFEDGHPRRSEYRRYRIRVADGTPNDYGMMREVLSRRLKAAVSGNVKFQHLPDLLLVDGGAGQLGVAMQAMQELGFGMPAAGLAKEHEHVYLPGRKTPISLPEHSRALHLLQRVRDEAHRFAISYHRSLHAREARESVLDDIPGIGARRKERLLRRFRTLGRLREASAEEIAQAAGCGLHTAETVLTHLRRLGSP